MGLFSSLLGCVRRSQWTILLLHGGLWPLWLWPGLAAFVLWGFSRPAMWWMLASPEKHHISYEWLIPAIQIASCLSQNIEGTDIANIVVDHKLIIFVGLIERERTYTVGPWPLYSSVEMLLVCQIWHLWVIFRPINNCCVATWGSYICML